VKIAEIREHSTEELKSLLLENQRKMFDLRAQAVTEKLEDPTQISKTRKDIARMMLVLCEREQKNG
jgi:large subunit ribosomal protein L29